MAGPNSALIISRNPPGPSQRSRQLAATPLAASTVPARIGRKADVMWPTFPRALQSGHFADVSPVDCPDDVVERRDPMPVDEDTVLIHADAAVRSFRPTRGGEETRPRFRDSDDRAPCISRQVAVCEVEQRNCLVGGVEEVLPDLVRTGDSNGDSPFQGRWFAPVPSSIDMCRSTVERSPATTCRQDRWPTRLIPQTSSGPPQ